MAEAQVELQLLLSNVGESASDSRVPGAVWDMKPTMQSDEFYDVQEQRDRHLATNRFVSRHGVTWFAC